MEYEWFTGSCEITSYKLEELLGTKLRALYQRRKGRDLFDLLKAITTRNNIDSDSLIKCYLEYIPFTSGQVPSQQQFADNLDAKMKDNEFLGDITALIRPTEKYDQHEANSLFKNELMSRL